MRVGDLMTKPVVVVEKAASLEAAARLMVDRGIGSLLVVDGQGRLEGIITESDFQAHHGFAPFSLFEMPRLFGRMIDVDGLDRIYAEARKVPVAQVMTPRPSTLEEDADVEKAARIMIEQGCHHVPVVREGKPVGMVARRDLVRMLIRP